MFFSREWAKTPTPDNPGDEHMNMKKLSVAILGLAGFAFAGMAAAACPTDSVPPWSSKSMLGGNLTISTPGFGGTD